MERVPTREGGPTRRKRSLANHNGRFVSDLAEALEQVANGDFNVQLPAATLRGSAARVAIAFNRMVERNTAFADELARVRESVTRDGHISDRMSMRSLPGGWGGSVQAINTMITELFWPTSEMARIITSIANGDLSQKMHMQVEGKPLRGEFVTFATAVNGLVDQLREVSAEVIRVSREVGREGNLGAQAEVRGVSGTWRDLTDNVNMLAGNLTDQVRNIALVTTAVANGDLSQKITVDARGEILELKKTINGMVDQLRTFAAEVTRVAREVGTEGKLGGQADVKGVSGTWKDLTDSVNLMASNLTNQVRGIVKVVTAVANGDLSQRFVVEAKGEIAALADTINGMTSTLRLFAEQVTTVAREVGIDGVLGGQARVPGVAGTWRDLTESVNMLAGNLTNQVRNIALVTTAVANGDLSQKITVDARGEILELKSTVNTMVDQLRAFAREVIRVAREVGTDGKLGGQAAVPGVAGTWQNLTENVNLMASNLTNQVRGIVKVVTAVAQGDLSQKLVVDAKGEIAALAETINGMTDTLRVFADQVTTVAREVGIDGKLGGQARVPGASGTWRDLTDNVNMLAGNLTSQVRNIALVTTAVANGDLSKKITVDAFGEILELKNTINAMVDQLRTFAAEVTRVAGEVGTEGKLGGQAKVPGVAGTWMDLTDNVNQMASNLTDQVRGIVRVVTAVANGDLTQKLTVEAKGEIAALADTINDMTTTLGTFAEQVTTVAREVGIEGKLGGQARVPGAAGTWRDLVDNVNQLAGNLTTQVRAIAEVATAVTKGDLTRTIDVIAQGEVLALKDRINQMIANLRDTTRSNEEQDWLKTNLAKFTGMMQGQRSLESLGQLIMSELTPVVSAQLGTFFVLDENGGSLRMLASYGYRERKDVSSRFRLGESLIGQAALEKKTILVTQVPPDYVAISSSLGEAPPLNIVLLPVLFEEQVKGVIELGSFHAFNAIHLTFLEQLALSIGVVFNMISAGRRTEELLKELQGSNAELEKRTRELEDKASLLEVKNREIAHASASLEEKAKQLALVSKYKSEFLANMSHELRTPLNSILILANLLVENEDRTLSQRQIEYAHTILTSGRDLMGLISQILDLSKIEAGKTEIASAPCVLMELTRDLERHYRALAEQKQLAFSTTIESEVPPSIRTDRQRLEQILRNLLSNAFKFTERGRIELGINCAPRGTPFQLESLRSAQTVIAFSVSDTGIGIPEDKQQVIFEAFQQADASTSRTYGGTGLGLTISRELARLLGGEIQLQSVQGVGSTFRLFLPVTDEARALERPVARPPRELGEPETPLRLPPTSAPPSPPAPAPRGLSGKRVLIVDDDVRNLFAVTSLLSHHGVTVVPAASGPEAIRLLRADPAFDLVLMDIMMPEMDGYEATREIRRLPSAEHLPIIALTAKAMPGDRDPCLAAGCNDFVAKPVEAARLLEKIREWCPSVEPHTRPPL